jgi:hypothetical protein
MLRKRRMFKVGDWKTKRGQQLPEEMKPFVWGNDMHWGEFKQAGAQTGATGAERLGLPSPHIVRG